MPLFLNDTDSELLLLRKHKLLEAYEQLTEHACDVGNLLQTLCVQCAQTVRDFSRFREQSLRARSLMMHLLQTHGLITMRHLELIKRERELKRESVTSPLEADDWDSHMEHDANNQTAPEEYDNVEVKTEPDSPADEIKMLHLVQIKREKLKSESVTSPLEADDSNSHMEHDADNQTAPEEDDNVEVKTELDSPLDEIKMLHLVQIKREGELKSESVTSPLEADDSDLHMEHDADNQTAPEEDDNVEVKTEPDSPSVEEKIEVYVSGVALPPRLATNNEYKARATEGADTTQRRERARATDSDELHNRQSDSDDDTRTDTRNYDVVLYDIFKHPNFVSKQNESLMQTRQTDSSWYSLNSATACKDAQYRAASESEVAAAHDEPVASALSDTKPSTSRNTALTQTLEKLFTCDVCQLMFTRKRTLVGHVKTHSIAYACKLSSYKSVKNSELAVHMRTHTDGKPFSCELCDYKCAENRSLARHMRTHTDEKPYSCELCEYKSSYKHHLTKHMRLHSGEKPYACKYCEFKCSDGSHLIPHTRTHTGEKPYACKYCEYRCSNSSYLAKHTRTHTGEKPFSCELCTYKCAFKCNLVKHKKTHTGEMAYACTYCEYKCTRRKHLVTHTRTHTGENGLCL